jgi:hypothetical protein
MQNAGHQGFAGNGEAFRSEKEREFTRANYMHLVTVTSAFLKKAGVFCFTISILQYCFLIAVLP